MSDVISAPKMGKSSNKKAPSTLLQIPGSTSVNLVFIRLVWLGSIYLLTNFFQPPVVHANPIHLGGAFNAPAVYDNPLCWPLEEFSVGVVHEVVLSLIGLSACLGVSITFNTRKCLQGEHPERKATASLAFASILLVLMLPALITSPFQSITTIFPILTSIIIGLVDLYHFSTPREQISTAAPGVESGNCREFDRPIVRESCAHCNGEGCNVCGGGGSGGTTEFARTLTIQQAEPFVQLNAHQYDPNEGCDCNGQGCSVCGGGGSGGTTEFPARSLTIQQAESFVELNAPQYDPNEGCDCNGQGCSVCGSGGSSGTNESTATRFTSPTSLQE
ncbi:hypothetical protein BGZ57DRAFT_880093 [Hyaloscypha finlandica]|nr:hypothetical protein BGZ57DRAFT_880093 [Hyaloscypha finlandica]